MSFATVAIVAGGIKAATGIASAIGGWKKKKAAKKANDAAKKELDKAKKKYLNFDTSNPYLNMENTMEDLTVNTQAADFAKQQSQQSEANILQNMNQAAGGSGVAALAQALANQGQIGAQKASMSIAEQEKQNQAAERKETSRLQGLEREGEIQSRNLKANMAKTEMGLASTDVQATAAEKAAGQQQMWGGIKDVGTAVGSIASGLGMKKTNSSLKMRSPIKAEKPSLNVGSHDVVKYYADAREAMLNEKDNWSMLSDTVGDFSTGIADYVTQQREIVKKEEEAEEVRIRGYEDMLSKNVDIISQNAGSLGKEYYNIAYDQAEVLKQQYMEALEAGDKKKMGEIKMQLQGLSTSVGTLKEGLNFVSEVQSNEEGKSDLSKGMSEYEKMVLATCTDPNNMVYVDGTFKWKNPDYDPSVKGSKEFFEQEDFSKAVVQFDRDASLTYQQHESSFIESGANFVNGVEGAGNFMEDRYTAANKEFITQDNIASIMWDDYRGAGEDNTFEKQIGAYLEQVNYEDLGLDPKQWDTSGDGIVSAEDFELKQDRKKLYRAITDTSHPLFDFETSRGLVAEWLTTFQKKKFYGDSDPNLKPEPGQTLEEFINAGGVAGLHIGSNSNYTYSEQYGFRLKENLTAEEILEKSKE